MATGGLAIVLGLGRRFVPTSVFVRGTVVDAAQDGHTLALSPGESGNRSPSHWNSRDWIWQSGIRKTRNAQRLFLLPGGEGQDEGERRTILPHVFHWNIGEALFSLTRGT